MNNEIYHYQVHTYAHNYKRIEKSVIILKVKKNTANIAH